MPRVSIKQTIMFNSKTEPVAGRLFEVRLVMRKMFEALDRFQEDKGIQLEDIRISTEYSGEKEYLGSQYTYTINCSYTELKEIG